MTEPYPLLPWTADPEKYDEEMFRIIRASDGRPIFYVDKFMSAAQADNVSRLIVSSPALLAAVREVFYATGNRDGSVAWTAEEWRKWRNRIGATLADCWPVEWNNEQGNDHGNP